MMIVVHLTMYTFSTDTDLESSLIILYRYFLGSSNNDNILVAALDFGTTYSGFAFSTRADFCKNPLNIYAKESWNAGGRQLLSLKTPTCLLLDAKKNMVAFGYDAENKYIDIVIDKEQTNYYYFYRFKMELFNKKVCNLDKFNDILSRMIWQFFPLTNFSFSLNSVPTFNYEIKKYHEKR